jgi:hypothetical protein
MHPIESVVLDLHVTEYSDLIGGWYFNPEEAASICLCACKNSRPFQIAHQLVIPVKDIVIRRLFKQFDEAIQLRRTPKDKYLQTRRVATPTIQRSSG